MLEHVGIEGCGGPTSGVDALHYAAQDQRLDVMVSLMRVGVVDTGERLSAAVGFGRVASVRFLLRQQELRRTSGVRAYVNDSRDAQGPTPVYRGVLEFPPAAPRIIQRLVQAGAEVASPVPVPAQGGTALTMYTPLGLANLLKRIHSGDGGDKRRNTLEAIRRLLMRVEAVRATSWLWVSGFPLTGQANTTMTTSAALTPMLPIIRRRAARGGVLLAPMFRHSGKPST